MENEVGGSARGPRFKRGSRQRVCELVRWVLVRVIRVKKKGYVRAERDILDELHGRSVVLICLESD